MHIKQTVFLFLILLLLWSCSPIPRASYGFVGDIIEEQSLDTMEIDIKIGNAWETMRNCNTKMWQQGEWYSTITPMGLIFGCVWVGGYSKGKIDKCWGYATPSTYEHELQHCKGFKDHPIFGF